MGLVNLTTNLKSLRYGKDQLGGGYSGQPYIKASIPEGFNNLQLSNNDFILRGGALAARNSATDVLRLGKMFADTKSPNGLLFIAKQNLLSRTAVRTQTSGLLNEGVYSPLSTLAEVGLVAYGGHLNKQGLNPFKDTGAYSNNSKLYGVKIKNDQPSSENRLVELYNTKQEIKIQSTNIQSYSGGPGSILGIGTTNIQFAANQRTGINNSKNPNGWYYGPLTWTPPVKVAAESGDVNIIDQINNNIFSANFISLQSYSNDTSDNVYQPITSYITPTIYVANLDSTSNPIFGNQTPQPGTLPNEQFPQNTFAYTQNIISVEGKAGGSSISSPTSIGSPTIRDFRTTLRSNLEATQQKNSDESGATPTGSDYTNYTNYTIEKRVRIGSKNGLGPGYKTGKNLVSYTNGSGIGPVDRINAFPVYKGETVKLDSETTPVNDLVKFRIAVINNQNPTEKTFIHFRAFIDNFSDSYNATWNPVTYLGRGENFYTYSNYTRNISMGWTVAAQSKEELIPMYKKLNYLASSLTPYYTPDGYMTGNLVQLTVGGYLYEQVGIINSLTYDIPEESPWEIGIRDIGGYDSTVKELPHIMRVTNFSFTPIQDFIPSVQPVGNEDGLSRYISLANGEGNDNTNYLPPLREETRLASLKSINPTPKKTKVNSTTLKGTPSLPSKAPKKIVSTSPKPKPKPPTNKPSTNKSKFFPKNTPPSFF